MMSGYVALRLFLTTKGGAKHSLSYQEVFVTRAATIVHLHEVKSISVPDLRTVAICFSLAVTVSSAMDGPSLARTKVRYYEAVDGDRSALEEAKDAFSRLRQTHPDDPLILAYAGSTQLLEASKTLAIWRKGKLSKQGLDALDEAVARAPEDPEIRFIRAASTYHLPSMFKRSEQSRADFQWLASRVAGAVSAGTLDPRLGAAALYHHGLLQERAGDKEGARVSWREAVRIGGNTRAASDAGKRLASAGH
jgi:hypothetical protein